MSKKLFLKGTLILTGAGLLTRFIGFFYRIFLSHSIGAQGIGIYQLLLPVQMLVMALTASGMQTAISRLSASHFALEDKKTAKDYFFTGTFVSVLFSSFISFLLYKYAHFFACEILKEPRTLPLIRLLTFSFPLSALHGCVNSYYFARKKAEIPGGLQLLEQLVRVGVTYLLYVIFLSEHREITPMIAAGGSLASEGVVALVSFFLLHIHFQKDSYSPFPFRQPFQILKELMRTALPFSLNRLLLTLLNSIEVILIPQRLQIFGATPAEALSIYGIFTGMALPMILFPSAVTNSAAVILMPSMAELQALGYKKRIRYVTGKICQYCLLLGSLCALFFFFFGKSIGSFVFHSPTAGIYIKTMALICPFLYLNTTLSSVLNGLGRSGLCLFHNAAGVVIRIGFVLYGIPVLGIRGYLYGILFSQLILTLLHTWTLLYGKHLIRDNLPIDN